MKREEKRRDGGKEMLVRSHYCVVWRWKRRREEHGVGQCSGMVGGVRCDVKLRMEL